MFLISNTVFLLVFSVSVILNCFFIVTYFKQSEEIVCLNSEIFLLQKSILELQNVSATTVEYSVFKDPYVIASALFVGGVLMMALFIYFGTPPGGGGGGSSPSVVLDNTGLRLSKEMFDSLSVFSPTDIDSFNCLREMSCDSTLAQLLLKQLAILKFISGYKTEVLIINLIENPCSTNYVAAFKSIQSTSAYYTKIVELLGPFFIEQTVIPTVEILQTVSGT